MFCIVGWATISIPTNEDRPFRTVPSRKPPKSAPPTEATDDLVLAQSLEMLQPLVRLLVSQGVSYSALTKALKAEFVQAAREQLSEEGAKVTDAAVSLRSGVHRKDVRVLNQPSDDKAADSTTAAFSSADAPRSLSLAGQVYTIWTTDARYLDAKGQPLALPATGPAPSFESLARSISTDLSRRTILDELGRLGLVKEEGDTVTPMAAAMVPTKRLTDTLHYLSENVKDHLNAGVANLNAVADETAPPHLEHSMIAAGLSNDSIEQLANLAGQLWKPVFNQSVDAARKRYSLDESSGHTGRIRFGVYVYTEADESKTDSPKQRNQSKPAVNKANPKPTKTKPKKAGKASGKKS
ncbi:MAG: DUF6502 family protein [Burkholderiaceae bacterium]